MGRMICIIACSLLPHLYPSCGVLRLSWTKHRLHLQCDLEEGRSDGVPNWLFPSSPQLLPFPGGGLWIDMESDLQRGWRDSGTIHITSTFIHNPAVTAVLKVCHLPVTSHVLLLNYCSTFHSFYSLTKWAHSTVSDQTCWPSGNSSAERMCNCPMHWLTHVAGVPFPRCYPNASTVRWNWLMCMHALVKDQRCPVCHLYLSLCVCPVFTHL